MNLSVNRFANYKILYKYTYFCTDTRFNGSSLIFHHQLQLLSLTQAQLNIITIIKVNDVRNNYFKVFKYIASLLPLTTPKRLLCFYVSFSSQKTDFVGNFNNDYLLFLSIFGWNPIRRLFLLKRAIFARSCNNNH